MSKTITLMLNRILGALYHEEQKPMPGVPEKHINGLIDC